MYIFKNERHTFPVKMNLCNIVLCHFGLFAISGAVRGVGSFGPDSYNNHLELSNSPKRRIKRLVEGREDSVAGERNYVASFQRRKDSFHLCTVNFITLKTVLTTCSCVLYVPDTLEYPLNRPQDYVIVAGVKEVGNKKQSIMADVKKLLRDKKCEYVEKLDIWIHNLGYMELKNALTAMPNLNVIPNLPKSQKEYELAFREIYRAYMLGERNWCWTYGWGASKPGSGAPNSKTLLKKPLRFIDLFNCIDRLLLDSDLSYVPFDTDNSDAVCAGGLQIDIQAGFLCYGDQGVPLICNGSFVAVGTPTKLCAANSRVSMFQKLRLEDMYDFKNLLIGSAVTNKSRFVIFLLLQWPILLLVK